MDAGRGKREEGRGKREEGRGKREEGRGKRSDGGGARREYFLFAPTIAHGMGAARAVLSTMSPVARRRYEMTDRQQEAGGADGFSHFVSLSVLEEECSVKLDSH